MDPKEYTLGRLDAIYKEVTEGGLKSITESPPCRLFPPTVLGEYREAYIRLKDRVMFDELHGRDAIDLMNIHTKELMETL